MFPRAIVLDLAERAATTYVLVLVTLGVGSMAMGLNPGSAFAWSILPAALELIRGIIAAGFGSEHTASFIHHKPAAERRDADAPQLVFAQEPANAA